MDRKRFQALVGQAFEQLPDVFREKLKNVAIIVEDLPPRDMTGKDLLLGLFYGIPRTEKSVFGSNPPDLIYLYQKNIEAICMTENEVCRQIRATLQHEIGHLLGLREDELRDV